MFNNKFKEDALSNSVALVMKENAARRAIENKLLEQLHIPTKLALPYKDRDKFDSLLEQAYLSSKGDEKATKTLDESYTTFQEGMLAKMVLGAAVLGSAMGGVGAGIINNQPRPNVTPTTITQPGKETVESLVKKHLSIHNKDSSVKAQALEETNKVKQNTQAFQDNEEDDDFDWKSAKVKVRKITKEYGVDGERRRAHKKDLDENSLEAILAEIKANLGEDILKEFSVVDDKTMKAATAGVKVEPQVKDASMSLATNGVKMPTPTPTELPKTSGIAAAAMANPTLDNTVKKPVAGLNMPELKRQTQVVGKPDAPISPNKPNLQQDAKGVARNLDYRNPTTTPIAKPATPTVPAAPAASTKQTADKNAFAAADSASMKNINVGELNKIKDSNLSGFGKAFQTARSLQGIKADQADSNAKNGKTFFKNGKEYGIDRKDERAMNEEVTAIPAGKSMSDILNKVREKGPIELPTDGLQL